VWAAGVKEKAAPETAERTVNYNTYLLGREGYFSLNFVTDAASIEARKPLARTLLSGITFDLGKRYDDFSATTDQVAAYGITALVGGVALKKVGVFALIAAFVVKLGKFALVLAAGLIAALAKVFRRKPPAGT